MTSKCQIRARRREVGGAAGQVDGYSVKGQVGLRAGRVQGRWWLLGVLGGVQFGVVMCGQAAADECSKGSQAVGVCQLPVSSGVHGACQRVH